jgi:CTP:phosphocholine cytidylyltransferase-like protein/thiamine kinase-like enzyme
MFNVNNAIILAAGRGTRILPITLNKPKPLINVEGKAIIEHQIKHLTQIGVSKIYIVVGYLAEHFKYLTHLYPNIELCFNDKYKTENNISSLVAVKDKIENSYILEGDVYIKNNIFTSKHEFSTIYALFSQKIINEWGLEVDRHDRLLKVNKTAKNQPYLSGVSFWTKNDAEILKTSLEKNYTTNSQLFWEEATYMENLKNLHIKVKPLKFGDVKEIDTIEDLKSVDKKYTNLTSLNSLQINYNNQIPIKTGITNDSFIVSSNLYKENLIIRLSKNINHNFIDREKEASSINLVKPLNISEDVVFIDSLTGTKVAKKIESQTIQASEIKTLIPKVAEILNLLHSSYKEEVINFNEFDFLDSYINQNKSFLTDEYFAIYQKLKLYNSKLPKLTHLHFCHRDLVPENFLKQQNKLFLIDWEYASFFDPMFDIASLFDESNFNTEEEEIFFLNYKASSITKERIIFWKIYLNLLWSIWCYFFSEEYLFDEYRKTRLQKAKDYLNLL